MVAVDLRRRPRSRVPCVPGLPDDAFDHDGQLTKGEVRAVTLAALAPCDGELLWDVGAGAGSVAIEWLRAGRGMRAIAIERDPTPRRPHRRQCRTPGRARAGRPHRRRARRASAELPAPDAIFVGGGIAAPGLLDLCWNRLGQAAGWSPTPSPSPAKRHFWPAMRRMAASCFVSQLARAETVGTQLVWRPAMPVTQLAVRK